MSWATILVVLPPQFQLSQNQRYLQVLSHHYCPKDYRGVSHPRRRVLKVQCQSPVRRQSPVRVDPHPVHRDHHRVQADPRRVRVLVRVDPRLVAPRLLLLMEGPSISQRRAHYLVLNPSPNLPPLTTQALVRHAPAPTAVHELYPPPDLSHPMPLLLLLPALHTPRLRLRWLQPKSSPSHRLVRNRTRLVLKPSNLIPRQVEKPVWPA